jgi:hypothetical protein
MRAFVTVNALVKELLSISEMGRPIVTMLMLVKLFEKSASRLKNIQMPMEAWHIATVLGEPISPIAAVDHLDKCQQELTIEWLGIDYPQGQ